MCIPLVHDFHSESSSVEDVSPGVDDFVLSIDDGLVKVEAVEVESHGRHAEGGKPDADDGPSSEEEVK